MTPKLSDDQRQALRDRRNGPIAIEVDQTRQRYVLIDEATHRRAVQALTQQEDLAAIHDGIDDFKAGRVTAFDEVDARLRAKLGLPPSP